MFIEFNRLIKEIEKTQKFLLVCHRNPDPDTIGSALALGKYIEACGKDVRYFCSNKIPANFKFLEGVEKFLNNHEAFGAEYGKIIFLDCSELSRAGVPDILTYKKQSWISIDHHASREKIWDWEIRDSGAAANCEIIYKFLKHSGFWINGSTATALLAGILIDTNYLSNAATKGESISTAAELCSLGADYRAIIRSFYMNKDQRVLKLWGLGLARLKYNKEKNIATTAILKDDLSAGQIGALESEEVEEVLGGFSNFLNAVLKSEVIMVLRESGNAVRGSIRTISPKIDVAKIAEEYGGGGHAKAAGFLCPGRLVEKENEWSVERVCPVKSCPAEGVATAAQATVSKGA